MHGIWARRQFEHGMCLSQRTFLLRQVTQLRGFRRSEGVAVGVNTCAPGKAGCEWGCGDVVLWLNAPLLLGESVVDGRWKSAKDSSGLVGFDGFDGFEVEVGGGSGCPVLSILKLGLWSELVLYHRDRAGNAVRRREV